MPSLRSAARPVPQGWHLSRPGNLWRSSSSYPCTQFVVDQSNGHCPACSSRDFRPFEVEVESDFGQPCFTHGVTQALLLLGVEHQEAAAASPDQLAADGAVVEREVVPLVDLRIRHAARALALVLPMLVHQLAEADKVPL